MSRTSSLICFLNVMVVSAGLLADEAHLFDRLTFHDPGSTKIQNVIIGPPENLKVTGKEIRPILPEDARVMFRPLLLEC